MLNNIYNLFISFMLGVVCSGFSVYKIYSWKVASVEIKEERHRYDVLLKEYQEYIKETEKNFSYYSIQLNELNNKKIELDEKQKKIIEDKNKEIIDTRNKINNVRQSLSHQRMDSNKLSDEHKRLLTRLTQIANGVPKTASSNQPVRASDTSGASHAIP